MFKSGGVSPGASGAVRPVDETDIAITGKVTQQQISKNNRQHRAKGSKP
jgi:hypothetical protein